MSVLELSGVSKRFGGLQALSEISLSVSVVMAKCETA